MSRRVRIAIAVLALVVVLLLLYAVGSTLTPFFVALAIAYVLDPPVSALSRRGVRRPFAVAFLAVAFFAVATLALLFVVPRIREETVGFIRKLPQYTSDLKAYVDPWLERVHRDYPAEFESARERILEVVRQQAPLWMAPISRRVASVFSSAWTLLGGLLDLVLIPVLVVYLLNGFDRLRARTAALLPLRYRDIIVGRARQADRIIAQFLRGQLTVSMILGVLYAIGLVALGVPLAIVVGLLSGLLNLVPYLGFVCGIATASVLAFVEHQSLTRVLLVWGLYALVQALEGTVIGPKIVGETLGLSPVIVILSLLVGTKLLGFVGMMIAVPVAAVLKVFVVDALERYEQSEFFRAPPVPLVPLPPECPEPPPL